jgi:hypothetical protein
MMVVWTNFSHGTMAKYVSVAKSKKKFSDIFFLLFLAGMKKYILFRELDLLHWVMAVNFFASESYMYTHLTIKYAENFFNNSSCWSIRRLTQKDRSGNCCRKTFLIRHSRQLYRVAGCYKICNILLQFKVPYYAKSRRIKK